MGIGEFAPEVACKTRGAASQAENSKIFLEKKCLTSNSVFVTTQKLFLRVLDMAGI